MRRIIFSLLLVILLMSTLSAGITINEQPDEIYNLGDTIPVTATVLSDVSGVFKMILLCEGNQIEFCRSTVAAGEKKEFEESVVLEESVISEWGVSTESLVGTCKIKAILGSDSVPTNDFIISDLLTINITAEKNTFSPEEGITIKGSAVKENGEDVKGFVEAEIVKAGDSGESLYGEGTINNGFFSLEIPLESDIEAGKYLVKINAYEKDNNGDVTNNGFVNYNIVISQIPTNLELIMEDSVEPGTNLVLKAILHDQTGESISSTATITVMNEKDIIIEQTEIPTDKSFEYFIEKNEIPSEWKISAESNELSAEETFEILEKASVDVEIINKTILITNDGNVFYNKTISVKIGDEQFGIDVELDLNESQKYVLNAPDGEYVVEVTTQEGNELSESVMLTGKSIGIEEAKGELLTVVQNPFVWIFVIVILGLVAFLIFKKVRKKTFSAKKGNFIKGKEPKKHSPEESGLNMQNKAELSLSIKGEKQDAGIVCLHLKNLNELIAAKSSRSSKKDTGSEGSAKEVLQGILTEAENHKAAVYRNQENIFFILAPVKTKTYKNEKSGLQFSQSIQQTLSNYNKIARQKIDFGISLSYGPIIAKQEGSTLKFMSLGTLITEAKKIAFIAKKEILLSGKINDRLRSSVKTEKHTRNNVQFYTILKVKNDEENAKFIRNFLRKIEKKD